MGRVRAGCRALFVLGLGWAMTGGRGGALTLFLGVAVAWNWIAAAILLRSRALPQGR